MPEKVQELAAKLDAPIDRTRQVEWQRSELYRYALRDAYYYQSKCETIQKNYPNLHTVDIILGGFGRRKAEYPIHLCR
jgi:hypothetical protein